MATLHKTELESRERGKPRPAPPPATPASSSLPLHRIHLYAGHEPPPILGDATIDAQLYELSYLVLRAHVLPWYGKITRDTRPFMLQVITIISHVIRTLERRLERVDVTSLLLKDVPLILERHVLDFREADRRCSATSPSRVCEMYHHLQPHFAIQLCNTSSCTPPPKCVEPKAIVSPNYLRSIVDQVLRVTLPELDYNCQAERRIVRELMVNVGLGMVFSKVCQPWFIHQLIIKICQDTLNKRRQSIRDNKEEVKVNDSNVIVVVWTTFFSFVVKLFKFINMLPIMINSLQTMISTPDTSTTKQSESDLLLPSVDFLKALLYADERTQIQFPLRLIEYLIMSFPTAFDNLVLHSMKRHVLSTHTLSTILESTTTALFPNGYPPESQPDPFPSTWSDLHDLATTSLTQVLPRQVWVGLGWMEGGKSERQLAQQLLQPFEDHACNVHLVLSILETTLATLFPELVAET